MAKKAARPAGKGSPKPSSTKRPARPSAQGKGPAAPAAQAGPAGAGVGRTGIGTAEPRQAGKGPEGRTGPASERREKTPAPAGSGDLKVRATMMGYYDNIRRRPGDVFVLKGADRRQFSSRWMEPVDPSARVHVTTGKQALQKQHDELLGKMIDDKNAGGTGSAAAAAGERSDETDPLN